MPRYWVCERCGTYNLKGDCETCGLTKEEAVAYETLGILDEEEEEDQEDWMLTVAYDLDEDYDWEE